MLQPCHRWGTWAPGRGQAGPPALATVAWGRAAGDAGREPRAPTRPLLAGHSPTRRAGGWGPRGWVGLGVQGAASHRPLTDGRSPIRADGAGEGGGSPGAGTQGVGHRHRAMAPPPALGCGGREAEFPGQVTGSPSQVLNATWLLCLPGTGPTGPEQWPDLEVLVGARLGSGPRGLGRAQLGSVAQWPPGPAPHPLIPGMGDMTVEPILQGGCKGPQGRWGP